MIPNVTSPKVVIPAALFLALSPGVLLTADGSSVSFMKRETSQMSVFFHALVFFLVYSLIAKSMGIVLTKTDLIVTIPPKSGGLFGSGQTSVEAVAVHVIVYALVFAILRRQFPQFY